MARKIRINLVKCKDGTLAAAKIFKTPEEFIHERFIMKQLKSSRIVKMFDGNLTGHLTNNYNSSLKRRNSNENLKTSPVPYLILEFAEHRELYDYLEICGPFNDEITRYYSAQILDAVEYLHKHNIAHRDIKPQNILLGKNYEIKLADLGLASDNSDIGVKSVRGTINYLPPEVLMKGYMKPSCEMNKKADIYALGIVLFNMITGGMPYSVASTEDKIFKEFLEDKKEFWKRHSSYGIKRKFSIALERLITGMLNPDPVTRLSLLEIRNSDWLSKEPMATSDEVLEEMETRTPYVELAKDATPEKKKEIIKMYTEEKNKKKKAISHQNHNYQNLGMLIWNFCTNVLSQ